MWKRLVRGRALIGLAVTAVVATTYLIVLSGPASADPNFQLPFPCGQKWRLNTWDSTHAPAVDMVKVPQSDTEGSLLIAPAAGTVRVSRLHENAGNLIQIDHGAGHWTTYIHLQSRAVSVGDEVAQGDTIGRVGHTGETSNGVPHLHYEQGFDVNDDGSVTWGFEGSERVTVRFDGVAYGPAPGGEWPNVESKNCDEAPAQPHGTVWDRTRSADGVWDAHATKIDDNPRITATAATGLPNGTMHVLTLLPKSGIWDRTRNTNGSWSYAIKIDTNGSVSGISVAALPDGTTHLAAIVPGSGIWHKVRNTAGTWSGATKIDSNGSLSDVALAGLPDGTLHLTAILPGSGIWHKVRNTAGTWSGATKIDSNPTLTSVSLAGMPDGKLHLDATVPGSGIWHKIRSAGAWSNAAKIDNNGAVFDVYTAGLPNGTLHVGAIPDLS